MTQALFTSMTGLNAGTEQLTVVSDNVANMNTTAYKTSRVDFQDIWYQTRTTGTNSTRTMGGTNPYQIGVGVQCASITKDFGASSTNTTGRTEDMAITGNGWFTVQNSDGKVLLTRDGTFSLDENGFLCTANGYKVLGTDHTESLQSSLTPIKVPPAIKVVMTGSETSRIEGMKSSELNGLGSTFASVGITSGSFKVIASKADGTTVTKTITLNNAENMTMSGMMGAINGAADGAFKAEIKEGKIVFTPQGDYVGLKFANMDSNDKDAGGNIIPATNFLTATELTNATLIDGVYSSRVIDYSASIGQVDSLTANTTLLYDEFSVGKDGLMTITYGDGSILTVKANDDGTTYFSYQAPSGVIINGNPENKGASLYVDPNILVTANLQMQMAKVVNDGGLVAEGNNQYSVGVNAGDVVYTAANTNGVGAVVCGALETSNVDLAQQFSNMILAQRLVQANSQVFSGANSMLETLVYLGSR